MGKRQIDTLDGNGAFVLGEGTFPVSYCLCVQQEFKSYRTKDGTFEDSGAVDLEGHLDFLGSERPAAVWRGGEGVLTLSDGRRVDIVFEPLRNAYSSLRVFLKGGFDLK